MATVRIADDGLIVEFSTRLERLFASREPLRVPLSAITGAIEITDPLAHTRGARKGMNVTGFTKIGTWGLGRGVRQLVCAYRAEPGIQVYIDRDRADTGFDELVLSTPDAAAVVRALANRVAAP